MTALLTVTGNPFSCPCFIPLSGLEKLHFAYRRLPGITARFHSPVIPRSRLQIQLHRIEKTARLLILSGIKQQMLHRCIRCYTDSCIALFFSFCVFHFPGKDRSLHPEPHRIFQMIHLCVINFHLQFPPPFYFCKFPHFFSFYHDPFQEKRFCFAGKNIFICTPVSYLFFYIKNAGFFTTNPTFSHIFSV